MVLVQKFFCLDLRTTALLVAAFEFLGSILTICVGSFFLITFEQIAAENWREVVDPKNREQIITILKGDFVECNALHTDNTSFVQF